VANAAGFAFESLTQLSARHGRDTPSTPPG
jgi:hypothetical protein